MTYNKLNLIIGTLLIIFAATLKVTTFPFSVNPIIAISLFSGTVIKDKKLSFLIPLLAMFVSDLLLEFLNIAPGFYGVGQIGNYASLLLVTVLGFGMKKINAINVLGFSIASSLLFFFLSNTNCFLFDNLSTYGSGLAGWLNCLIAGLPFVKNGLVIDLAFSGILYGSYVIYNRAAVKKVIQ
jgi:hypothetical protein